MKKKLPRKAGLDRSLISVAVAGCFATTLAFANPTHPTVVHGSAAFQQHGSLLEITNSPNTIINWGSFSIAANEVTRFIQQSAASAVLNRVIGQDPSSILGALQSNGRVFLVNPNGILFGAGAQIDVAGLVASTLNLSNADFLAGRLNFTEVPGAGSIVNQGNITAGQGGHVYLVAPDITNSGIIASPGGEVVLAAGKSVELVNPGTPNLRVEITAPDNEARNLGQIAADSGRVGIYAGLINHSGTIRADSAVVGENGQILLKATKNTTLESGSVISANGPSGGKIEIQSGDTTLISGTIEAKGTLSPPSEGGVAATADGVVEGKGGTIHILGNLVGLIDNARVDASGETGGGTVLVGGDFQGKPALSAVEGNPIQNAYRTYFGPDANIAADAISTGDGGKVIVWSDDATRAYGTISARGGAQSGNGGFVEISGKNYLEFHGMVNTLAPFGASGTLLLDPTDIEIVASITGTATLLDVNLFQDTTNVATSQIEAANLATLLGSTNVTVKTQSPGISTGTVTFNASVFKPATGGTTTLQVEAENNIIVAGGVTIGATSAVNPLNVHFFANSDNLGSGGISIGNGVDPTAINTMGGNIVLGGTGTNPAIGNSVTHGVFVNAATLNAGSGSITLRGRGDDDSGQDGGNHGVLLRGSTLETTSGNITIEGVGGLGDAITGRGVLIDQSSQLTSTSGAITITGAGASSGSGFGAGVEIRGASIVQSTGTATVSITGTGGTSDGPNDSGIVIADAGTTIKSVNGAITLTGTGGSATGGASNNSNIGISVALGALVESTGAATITMVGTGGDSPTNGDHGILITTGGIVRSADGAIMMTGTGGSATTGTGVNDEGIVLGTTVLVESTGSASITMVGIGGDSIGGGGGNVGVSMFGGAVVQSTLGAIDIQGTGRGTGAGNDGIRINNATVASLGSATIAMTGDVTGAGTGSGLEFSLVSVGSNTIGGASATGNITLTADSINMPDVTVQTTGTVFVRPLSTNRDIFIETGASAGLSLSPAEIQNITAGTVEIGRSSDTGTLTVSAALSSSNLNAGTLKLAHGNIAINEALAFTTDNENLFLTAGASGAISEGGNGAIATGGSTTLNAGTAITLGGANNFNQVNVGSGTNVTLNDINALVLNGVSVSGALNVTAGGAITQAGAIIVGGISSFNAAASAITLTNAGNNFTGAVSLTGGPVSITDVDAMTLGAVATSSLTVNAAGISQDAAGLAVSGTATFNAGAGAIALTTATNDFGTVVLSNSGANNVAITDANAIQFGASTLGSGSLTVNAVGITQSGGITQAAGAGAATFNGGAGAITLANAGNAFTGAVSLNNSGNNNVVLNNSLATTLGASSAGGTLAVTSGGAVTQTSALTVGGASSFSAGANPITLTNSGNSFAGAVSLTNSGANDAAVATSGTLNLGASNVGGGFTANAGNDLNLSGASTVGGNASLTAGNDLNLGSALTVGNNLTLTGGAQVRVSDATVSAGGAVDVTAAVLDITAATSAAVLQAGTNLSVTIADVMLQGGSVSGALAELRGGPGTFNVITSGDIVLSGGSGLGAFARIFGDPDANLTVGGAIRMNAGSGSGAFAAIEAASPASINIIFPNLATGGFFVNGVEGTIFDLATASGFMVAGLPAVPGAGFNVSYGVAGPIASTLTEPATTPLISPQISGTEQIVQTIETSDPLAQEAIQQALAATVQAASNLDEEKEVAPPLCR